jgi:O-antigen/teichoic acid export membrane protein
MTFAKSTSAASRREECIKGPSLFPRRMLAEIAPPASELFVAADQLPLPTDSPISGLDPLIVDVAMVGSPVVGKPTVESQGKMRKMSSASAVMQSVATKGLIMGINALTGIITARALRPAGRGELAAMILWPVLLANALSLGLPSALTFQLRRNPGKQSQLVGSALFLALLSSAAAALLGAWFMSAFIPQYPPRVILFARIFLLSAPITSLLAVGRASLESRGDFAVSNKLLLWTPAMTLVGLVGLLATRSMNPFSAALAYVPTGVVPLAWLMRRLVKAFRPSLAHFRTAAMELFSYGIRSYGIDLCGTMAVYVDQALVVRLLQPDLMGTYVVALSLSRILYALHGSVVMVLFPKAVSCPAQMVADMTSRATRMSAAVAVLGGIGIIALGPQVLNLFYGKAYRNANVVLRILVVEVILSGAGWVLSQAFMALGRPGVINALQVTGLALTVPLMFLLIPRFGIAGAGAALLCSTIIRLLFVLASFPIFLKMPVPNLLPKMEDLRFAADVIGKGLESFRGTPLAAVDGSE